MKIKIKLIGDVIVICKSCEDRLSLKDPIFKNYLNSLNIPKDGEQQRCEVCGISFDNTINLGLFYKDFWTGYRDNHSSTEAI